MRLLPLAIAAAMIVLPMTATHAQTSPDLTKANKPAASDGAIHKATGVVKSVDRNKSTVTLAHSPVASLNWPAMTMPFTVKNKALLDKLPVGGKIEFEFAQQGKDYVITRVN
jgi:Cu(I)/Ag(I) efflux system periplasmic protein CusF